MDSANQEEMLRVDFLADGSIQIMPVCPSRHSSELASIGKSTPTLKSPKPSVASKKIETVTLKSVRVFQLLGCLVIEYPNHSCRVCFPDGTTELCGNIEAVKNAIDQFMGNSSSESEENVTEPAVYSQPSN